MANDYRDDPNYGDEFYADSSLLSDCCGATALGETYEDAYGHVTGICASCRDHATFTQEPEDERQH